MKRVIRKVDLQAWWSRFGSPTHRLNWNRGKYTFYKLGQEGRTEIATYDPTTRTGNEVRMEVINATLFEEIAPTLEDWETYSGKEIIAYFPDQI